MRSGGAFDIPFFPGSAVSGMSLACVLSVHQYADDSKNVGPTPIGKKGSGKSKTASRRMERGTE